VEFGQLGKTHSPSLDAPTLTLPYSSHVTDTLNLGLKMLSRKVKTVYSSLWNFNWYFQKKSITSDLTRVPVLGQLLSTTALTPGWHVVHAIPTHAMGVVLPNNNKSRKGLCTSHVAMSQLP